MDSVKFKLLGTIGFISRTRGFVPVSGAQQRTVLAVLLLNLGRLTTKVDLFNELKYDTATMSPDNALQAVVSRLRRSMSDVFGKDFTKRCLVTQPAGYLLDANDEDVDATRFDMLISEARARMKSAPNEARELLDRALDLWDGPALQGVADGPICSSAAIHYEESRLSAMEERLGASFADGRHGEIIGELRRLSMMHPSRERLAEMLMLALYRTGRQAEAVEVYQRSRKRLVEEFGIEPSHNLKGRICAILKQDPMLLHSC
jgi:SARP family transcriptional regulator, regulator of embCAB operon